MNPIIKTATLKNLQNVQELNLKLFEEEQRKFESLLNLERSFGETGTKHYQDRISNDDGCVFVAVVDDNIVGYVCGGLNSTEDYRALFIVAQLESIFVLDEFRSRGIGQQLYNQFVAWCKTKHVQKIRVETYVQNAGAINFYKNNNFKDYTVVFETDL